MKYSILLVEDDPLVSDLISDILRASLSADVHVVRDNEAGILYLHRFKPNLVISDLYHAGEGTGIDLYNYIRNDPNIASIPIIIQSGHAKTDVELNLYRAGIQGVLRKPYRSDDLINIVSRILDEKADTDVTLLNLGYETKDLDYKQDLDMSNKEGRASLAKDVIAMANTGGGTIIIGVSEPMPGKFEKKGLPEEKLIFFESTKVGNALRKYIGSVISVTVKRLKWRSNYFIVIKIPACDGILAMAYCANEKANLYPGRIYVRNNSAQSVEVQDSLEVIRLLDKIVDSRIRSSVK